MGDVEAWMVTWTMHGAPYYLERFSNEDATYQATWLAEHGREEVKVLPYEVEVDAGEVEEMRERIWKRLQQDESFRRLTA